MNNFSFLLLYRISFQFLFYFTRFFIVEKYLTNSFIFRAAIEQQYFNGLNIIAKM